MSSNDQDSPTNPRDGSPHVLIGETINPLIQNQQAIQQRNRLEDPSDPYYLHHADNLGNVLVSQLLTGQDNYMSWSRAMQLAISVKNKLGFLDGDKINPNKQDSNAQKTQSQRRNRPFCTHCNILGHTIEKCYKIHGYPPGYNKNKGKEAAVNQIQTSSEGANSSNDNSTLLPQLTSAQYQQLLNLLATQHTGVGTSEPSTSTGYHPQEDDWQRSNNAPELVFKDLFLQHGVLHDFTCVETPEQNVVTERKHQHLLNVARALYFQSKIPIQYWTECVMTAAFLINRIPTPNLKNKSPYELLFKRQPDYNSLRNFGCLVFASTLTANRTKFSPRAKTCVFIGYPQGVKGYKLYDINNKQIFLSRNVIFHENVFPFHKLNDNATGVDAFTEIVLPTTDVVNTPVCDYPISDTNPTSTTSHTEDENATTSPSNVTSSTPATASSSPSSVAVSPPATSNELPTVPRRSTRVSKKPDYLKDFECYSTIQDHSSTPHYLDKYISYTRLSNSYKAFIFAVTSLKEPRTYKQAI
uniref:Integrase catalytic domain-containing protein n=1 Tax=Cannabis sativa TaxID=3483 RepID=A0A803NFI1_CANSA